MGKSPGVGPNHLFGENTLRDTFADVEMKQWLGGQVF